MTHDVVALLDRAPTLRGMTRALAHAGPELRVRPVADGALVQLRDGTGRMDRQNSGRTADIDSATAWAINPTGPTPSSGDGPRDESRKPVTSTAPGCGLARNSKAKKSTN